MDRRNYIARLLSPQPELRGHSSFTQTLAHDPTAYNFQRHHVLFSSGDKSDFEVTCQGHIWKLHRSILAARSDWFTAVLKSDWKEGHGSMLNLDEEDPELLDAVLKFIYTGDLDQHDELTKEALEGTNLRHYLRHAPPTANLTRLLGLYSLADLMMLDPLPHGLAGSFDATIIATMSYLYSYTVPVNATKLEKCVRPQGIIDAVLDDFRKAVDRAYGQLCVREMQQKLVVFAYGLREFLPRELLEHLEKNAFDVSFSFGDDLMIVLRARHFPSVTKGLIAHGAVDDVEVDTTVSRITCAECKHVLTAAERGKAATAPADRYEMVMDPFAPGNGCTVWCKGCAPCAIGKSLKAMVEGCWTESEEKARVCGAVDGEEEDAEVVASPYSN